jgi:hypothetical protein
VLAGFWDPGSVLASCSSTARRGPAPSHTASCLRRVRLSQWALPARRSPGGPPFWGGHGARPASRPRRAGAISDQGLTVASLLLPAHWQRRPTRAPAGRAAAGGTQPWRLAVARVAPGPPGSLPQAPSRRRLLVSGALSLSSHSGWQSCSCRSSLSEDLPTTRLRRRFRPSLQGSIPEDLL